MILLFKGGSMEFTNFFLYQIIRNRINSIYNINIKISLVHIKKIDIKTEIKLMLFIVLYKIAFEK